MGEMLRRYKEAEAKRQTEWYVLIAQRDALREQVQVLQDALEAYTSRCQDQESECTVLYRALEAARELYLWMTGSADFGPEGQAWEGWLKFQPTRDMVDAALKGSE